MLPPPVRRRSLLGLGLLLWVLLCGLVPGAGWAQSVEIGQLRAQREDGALVLEFSVGVKLTRAVEDALQRGVPVYFVAEATLRRHRWYWRDERVARISRSWRVAYQPLTSAWRVGLGGLYQTYPSLEEAMLAVTRSAGWRLASLDQLDPDSRYSIDFSYRLDSSQLPSPMQIGLGGQTDWAIGVERTLRLDEGPAS